MQYIKIQSYQYMAHFYDSHTKLSNEVLSIYIYQDLLHMPIVYFRGIISRINTIKFSFILIIILYFKIS